MKPIAHRKIALAVSLSLASAIHPLFAEDIDLYVGGNKNNSAPNVLLVLDNTSNWSGGTWYRKQHGSTNGAEENCGTDAKCLQYVQDIFGTNDSLKQGQVEAAVLKIVLNELVCNTSTPMSVNVGVEVFAPDKGANGDTSVLPGYIRRAVLPMEPGNSSCKNLITDFDAIISSITTPAYKGAASASYGELLFEAFKYFGGFTNPKHAYDDVAGTPQNADHFGPHRYSDYLKTNGTDPASVDSMAFVDQDPTKGIYLSPINGDHACGKNYIFFVGNGWPNKDNGTLLTNLDNSKTPDCCNDASGARLGDVWTKFLATTDVSSLAGQQPVYTFALNVFPPGSSETADLKSQRKLLENMAINGGTGAAGYAEVNGNIATLIAKVKEFFTTINAKNSVFASASLPVSVNTQGTYVNQVYIGMFRPDADGYQRWNGNLKQYRLAQNSTGTVYLADQTTDANGYPTAAVDTSNTGFIKQCAASYWDADTSNWKATGKPYWARVPLTQTPASECDTPPSVGTTTTFSRQSDWPDGNTVEKGGSGQWLRTQVCDSSSTTTYCGRKIKSCADTSCSTVVNFNSTNITSLTPNLINWVAGGNLGDGPMTTLADGTKIYQFYNGLTQSAPADDLTGGKSYTRPTVHGDVVHSRPVTINYGTSGSNDVVLFYGANDGVLRAVDGNRSGGTAGQEMWAFVAPEFFGKFNRLKENDPVVKYANTVTSGATPRDYFFDGSIGAYQKVENGTNKAVWVFPTMRRGGRMIYAFDATNRPLGSDATAPQLSWKFGCTNDAGTTCYGDSTSKASIGQTWSVPRAIRIKGDSNVYVAFGGGYDSCEDVDDQVGSSGKCGISTRGQGVFILTAGSVATDSSGNSTYTATTGAGKVAAYIDLTQYKDTLGQAITAGRVVADVVPVDVDLDGYTDLIYVVDTRGNVWRITTSDSAKSYTGYAPNQWSLHTARLAYVSDFSSNGSARKLMSAPDVVKLGGVNILLFGSGDREHPLASYSKSAYVYNRFYGIYDDMTVSEIPGTDCDTAGDSTLKTGCMLVNVTTPNLDYTSALAGSRGWYFALTTEPKAGEVITQEQVVTTPVTAGGTTYFSTFQPTDPSDKSNVCSNLGTARGYTVSFLNGDIPAGESTRATPFVGGGLPPSPVAGVVQLDDGKLVPFVLGGKGGSALEAGKVKVNINNVRKRIYRYQGIDSK